MKISFTPSTKEVKSVVEQMEKQQITVGSYLQNLILTKRKEEGKEPKNVRECMQSQRGYVWEIWRSSNLIQSALLESYIPPIQLYRHDDKSQFRKTVDGQQRLTTFYLFVNNLLKLDLSKSISPMFEIEGEQYTYTDLQGKTFSELPELFQDIILNYDLQIVTINNCNNEQAERYYVTMNAGVKTLKAAEIRKAAMGMSTGKFFSEVLKSDWIYHTLTPKAATTNTGNEIISQVITLMQNQSPVELSKENIDKVIYSFRNSGVPEYLKNDIINICNYLNEVTNIWIENKKKADEEQTAKKGKRVSNYATYRFSFFNKTSVVMLMMATDDAIKGNVTATEFASWSLKFFKEPNQEYNNGLGDKTNELKKVEYRLNAIQSEIEKLKGYEPVQNQVEFESGVAEEQEQEEQVQEQEDENEENDQPKPEFEWDDQDEKRQEQILTLVKPEPQSEAV